MSIKVFITIDVETSIGGAFEKPYELRPVGAEKRIYGRIKNKEYGIPLIMDILEQHNLKGTFFVEPFCSFYFGEKMVSEVCQYIVNRGHDVQMHLHPNYQIFRYPDWKNKVKNKKKFSDIIADYPLEKQIEIIKEAKQILQKCGVNPTAFRAGCFGSNLDTLKALQKNDFLFDTSYNASFLNKTCFINSDFLFNNICKYNDIYELPVTNYYEFKIANYKKLRHLDICAASFYEIKQILKKSIKYKLDYIVILLHSFSFLKKRDVQYKITKPNFIVINRFKHLCRFLSTNTDLFKVTLFSEFAQFFSKCNCLIPQSFNQNNHQFPFIGNIPSLLRYATQAIQYL